MLGIHSITPTVVTLRDHEELLAKSAVRWHDDHLPASPPARQLIAQSARRRLGGLVVAAGRRVQGDRSAGSAWPAIDPGTPCQWRC